MGVTGAHQNQSAFSGGRELTLLHHCVHLAKVGWAVGAFMRRAFCSCVGVLALVGCGRTGLSDDGRDDPTPLPVTTRAEPLFVAKGGPCPTKGVEADLKPTDSSDRLVLIETTSVYECTDVSGEYLVGLEVGTPKRAWVGDHGCYFISEAFGRTHPLSQGPSERWWGVARFRQTAAWFVAPTGVCTTPVDGLEGVGTDSRSVAWAVYGSEAAARSAFAALKP